VGCNLVVLKMTCSQSGCKVQRHFFSAARTSNSRRLVLWSKDAMRVSFYFERGCPEQRPRAALKPQPRAQLERALDLGRPRRGLRGSWIRGRGVAVASGKLQELSL
jgi:hypothetical protein